MKNTIISGKPKNNSPLERGLRGVLCKRQKSTSAPWIVIAIIITAIFQFLSCCEDCPTCPEEPEPSEPGSYYVYMPDATQPNPGYIWVIDSKTNSAIDSILTPKSGVRKMACSSDGKYLVVYTAVDPLKVYDTETKELIAEVSPPGEFFFSLDNSYLIIGGFSGGEIHKISTATWTEVASDTLSFRIVDIFHRSPYVLGLSTDYREYVIYDYGAMNVIKIDSLNNTDGSTFELIYDMVVSFDDAFFYFTYNPNKIYKFDNSLNEIVDSVLTYYGGFYGYLANSPDGSDLLYTEVPHYSNPILIGNLLIIEQEKFEIKDRINTWGLNPVIPGEAVLPGVLAVTPDGSKVFCGFDTFGGPIPVSFNLIDKTASDIKGFNPFPDVSAVAIGKKIE